jgi:hypothetical protein
MEKPYHKLIVLVLASHNEEVYRKQRKIYQEYYNVDPDIKVFLIYGNPGPENAHESDLIFPDIEENYYPGMIMKTVKAMDFVHSNYTYDFLLRTNISTFWDFPRLIDRIKTFSAEKCFTGNFRKCKYKDQQSPNYVAGINLILSYDLVECIVQNQEEVCRPDLPEDWALSQFLIDRGYNPKHTIPRALHFMEHLKYPLDEDLVLKEIQDARKENRDHFRIKSRANRNLIDAEIANILLREYYGKQAVL